ncbi:MAG: citryl-CoA lyase [Gemmatimonadota bacterium]
MEPWKTALSDHDATHIWIRGHDITSLMKSASFTDVFFLLHHGKLPSAGERELLDAMLIAAADHGPGSPSAAAARFAASGNRQAPEAALSAGILAIGDVHGGAGPACMELIAAGVARSREQAISIEQAADHAVIDSIEHKVRVPGLGHRAHAVDPRTAVLFGLAEKHGIAGNGVRFMEALAESVKRRIKPLTINVDGAQAALLHDMGCAPLFAKFLFIIGRSAGLTAQVTEEYTRERPMRIHVPVTYDGAPPIQEGKRDP